MAEKKHTQDPLDMEEALSTIRSIHYQVQK